jgi:hypothetical protein
MPEPLTQENWTQQLHEDFHVHVGDANPLMMKLMNVTGHSYPGEPARQSYSLLFCGPATPILPQRTYRLAHAEIGEVDIFLVPVGKQKEGVSYEAVFNTVAEI